MRIRAIKPGFFKNEHLCELSPWHRLCFEGLWLAADRDGRLEDRPRRLKADIFPYDDLEMDALLWELAEAKFIVRYAIGGQHLIEIPTWDRHQHPRTDEPKSVLPPYVVGTERVRATLPHHDATDADTSLSRDDAVTPQRIGQLGLGQLEIGTGGLEVGGGRSDGALAPVAANPATREGVRAQDLVDAWNDTVQPPIPRCRDLTDGRRQKIRARMAKRPALSEWRQAFEFVTTGDPFYRGQSSSGWVVDFDWFLRNDTNVTKVLERAQIRGSPRLVSVQGQQNADAMRIAAERIQARG